ncbi:MAG: AtpZ/AtpI family protein [Acidobacteriota bacterium]
MAISRENIRLIGQLSTVGLSFVLALVIGFGTGYLLDGWLGSKPWLSLLGFFLGLAAGILNVYRVMQLAGGQAAPRTSERERAARPR